ncbi:MAG: SRPBCC family protein [Streptosporangiaceae bacterium]
MADQTSSRITIAARKSAIMDVIADFAAYPEWAGAVREATVLDTGSDGRASTVRFVLDAGVLKDKYALGYEWDDDDACRWHLVEEGSVLRGMTGAYVLTEGGDGTEVRYDLRVDVKIPMIGMFRRKAEKVIIDTALGELKQRVER